jgi:hypothetical protein
VGNEVFKLDVLVNAPLVDLLEELVIVAIINMDTKSS